MSALIYPTSDLNQAERLVITRGQGVHVYDDSGRQYLEAMSGLWCTSLGYGNQELADVARQQMLTLPYAHLFGGKSHPLAEALAQKISDMVPMDNARVFLGTSGSDANDTLIKLLQYYFNGIGQPARKKLLARQQAYHGVTVAASTLTGLAATHAGFDVPFDTMGVVRVDAPHYYRNRLDGESREAFCDRLINDLEAEIQRQGPEHIAAMIVEPVSGAGGVIVPPDDYYPRLQALLNRYGIFLWDDEVICGFGRTGNDFGATTFGFRPDLMTFAKGLSSGYQPISAAVISADIYEAIAEASRGSGLFGHGYTYSGHPVACAVALKTLEIYERDDLFHVAARRGEYLLEQLRAFEQHPLVGEVRGRGLLAAIEFIDAKASDGSPVAYAAQALCQANGLIVRCVAGSALAICPPLVITEAEIDEIMAKLRKSLDELLADVTPNTPH